MPSRLVETRFIGLSLADNMTCSVVAGWWGISFRYQ
jgi:hypothetical protein